MVSGRWIRSLVGLRPSEGKGGGGGSGRGRKWSLLWRSSSAPSGSAAAASEASETSSSADALSAVVAAVVRAPHRDFRLIRQEWAAVRIQTAFRAFLARRALKALRGIVRLQALVRGRLVRKQLAVTLKCMHALVRVQERARERRARMSADGRDSQSAADERSGHADPINHADPIKETEQRWCNSQGTLDEIRSKIHMTHEGAIKRERAIAYALSHQRSSNHGGRPSSPAISLKNRESSKSNRHWSYLEPPINAQCLKSYEELKKLARSKHSDATSVKVRRNNVTTRVAARAPSAPSASSSDFVCDESSPSTSSVTPASGTNFLASERRFDGGGPGYMSLTESAKARLTSCSAHRAPLQRQGSEDLQCYNLVAFSSIDAQSNAGSERSVTSKRLNSSSLKGWSMTRSLDKENDDRSSSLF